jgi:glycosyltransferase involved in cell wall biosynthesis
METNKNNLIHLSIITVVYNDAHGLEKTIQSVLSQRFRNYEFLVFDGGSTDATIEIINKFSSQITYWTSEPDSGPYDAMNKGIEKSTGDWIIFMNSGDTFIDDHLLSRIFSLPGLNKTDVIFGDSIIDYKAFKIYKKAASLENIWKGMICSHQAMLFRAFLLKADGFNNTFRIGADYDRVCRLYKAGHLFQYFPEPMVNYAAFGISHREMFKSAREHFIIIKNIENLSFSQHLFHRCNLVYFFFLDMIYKVIPFKILCPFIRLIRLKKPV